MNIPEPDTDVRPVFECPSCGYRVGLQYGSFGGLPTLTCLDCEERLIYQGVE